MVIRKTFVPFGDKICTAEAADLTLASGVYHLVGLAGKIAALCYPPRRKKPLPTRAEERPNSLRLAVAGRQAVDGCNPKK